MPLCPVKDCGQPEGTACTMAGCPGRVGAPPRAGLDAKVAHLPIRGKVA